MVKYIVKPGVKLVKKANSRQSLRAFVNNSSGATILPDYSFSVVNGMIESDPVASGAVKHFVDKVVEGGFSVLKKDTLVIDETFEKELLYDFSWNTNIIKKITLIGKLYSNVFLEIVRGSTGKAINFNVLDSTNIEPITKSNGDPLKYKSKVPNPGTKTYSEWDAKDIVWFKFDGRTNGWAEVDIKALYTVLMQKNYINRFISWAWMTGQYRVVHNFKTSSSSVVQDFMAYNAKVDDDFTKPFIAGGEYHNSILRDMKEIDSLQDYLKYLDNQIVILLRVPPIDVGIPDSSGRSNADAQSNNLVTTVKSFKLTIADGNNELFRKINHGNNILVFKPSDRFEESMIFENVRSLKNIGMTDDALKEYMTSKGIVFKTKTLFEKFEDPKSGNKFNNPLPTSDPEAAPSRERKGVGQANNKIGTGNEGTTRDDQLVKKSYGLKDSYEYSTQWREY